MSTDRASTPSSNMKRKTPADDDADPEAVKKARAAGSSASIGDLRRVLVKASSSIKHTTVRVLVGANKVPFLIRSELLVSHSPFFATALGPNWQEGEVEEVPLVHASPESFRIFEHFLSQGLVHSKMAGDEEAIVVETGEVKPDLEWPRLFRAWVLGDFLMATSFKDAITDACWYKRRTEHKTPDIGHQYIYPHSNAPCGMRRLLVDFAVWRTPSTTFEELDRDPTWAEFFADVAVAAKKRVERLVGSDARLGGEAGNPLRSASPACRYHDHDTDDTVCFRVFFEHD